MTDVTPPSPDVAADAVEEPTGFVISSGAVTTAIGGVEGLLEVTKHEYASSDASYHLAKVESSSWLAAIESARDAGFDFFIDLYAVDHFSQAPRFEVGINLVSMDNNERLIISTRVPYDDPTLASATGLFVGANFYEREAYDLFGIDFPGHPDLTRILMPDDWEGFPLRKDYAVGTIPVQFKAGSVDL